MDEGIHDELRVALDASSAGATFLSLPLAYESDADIRKTTNSVVVSDVLVPPQHGAIEEGATADIGDVEAGC